MSKKRNLNNNQESIELFLKIKEIMKKNDMTHIEALLAYCEENDLEIETVSLLINEQLRYEIEQEATKLNLLKSNTSNTNTNKLFDETV